MAEEISFHMVNHLPLTSHHCSAHHHHSHSTTTAATARPTQTPSVFVHSEANPFSPKLGGTMAPLSGMKVSSPPHSSAPSSPSKMILSSTLRSIDGDDDSLDATGRHDHEARPMTNDSGSTVPFLSSSFGSVDSFSSSFSFYAPAKPKQVDHDHRPSDSSCCKTAPPQSRKDGRIFSSSWIPEGPSPAPTIATFGSASMGDTAALNDESSRGCVSSTSNTTAMGRFLPIYDEDTTPNQGVPEDQTKNPLPSDPVKAKVDDEVTPVSASSSTSTVPAGTTTNTTTNRSSLEAFLDQPSAKVGPSLSPFASPFQFGRDLATPTPSIASTITFEEADSTMDSSFHHRDFGFGAIDAETEDEESEMLDYYEGDCNYVEYGDGSPDVAYESFQGQPPRLNPYRQPSPLVSRTAVTPPPGPGYRRASMVHNRIHSPSLIDNRRSYTPTSYMQFRQQQLAAMAARQQYAAGSSPTGHAPTRFSPVTMSSPHITSRNRVNPAALKASVSPTVHRNTATPPHTPSPVKIHPGKAFPSSSSSPHGVTTPPSDRAFTHRSSPALGSSDRGGSLKANKTSKRCDSPAPSIGSTTVSSTTTENNADDCSTVVRKVKLKTEMCLHYLNNTPCPFGSACTYAHGEEELQLTKLMDLHAAGLVR
jgi:hypothetical protein